MLYPVMPEVRKEGDVTVIAFGPQFESLDEFKLDQFREFVVAAANAANPAKVVIDLTYTTFFGSAFIEVLFHVWKPVNGDGGKFALAGLTSSCREILEITHLDRLWLILPTVKEAVDAIS